MVLATCYVTILLKAHLRSFPEVWGRINRKRFWPRAMANEECSRIAKVQTHCFMDVVRKRDLGVDDLSFVLFVSAYCWHLTWGSQSETRVHFKQFGSCSLESGMLWTTNAVSLAELFWFLHDPPSLGERGPELQTQQQGLQIAIE